MAPRTPYNGPRQKLVLAFDIGTVYSGISYSVLDPGYVPYIKSVTRFPAHKDISGASKIPTIIYYDLDGKVQAVGAEAMGIYEQAEDERWVKAEWFTLHLRPRVGNGSGREISNDIQPLPLKKTVVEVFADFLAYLFECASSYIQDTHLNGVDFWASVKNQINFVLSHPNGSEDTQQSEMRKAAVLAGLISDTTAGHARLSFVTQGEAILHFAIQNCLPEGVVNNNEGVVIVDMGGVTIDVSSYSRNTTASKSFFEEVAAPQCHFHGSSFVSLHAHLFIQNYLAQSPFVDDVEHIVRCFDKTTKWRFRKEEEVQYVKFGSTRDNDARHNIRFGQLKLLGTDVASFFQSSIHCIVKAVMDQKKMARKPIAHVVLVGDLSTSDYVFNMVNAALAPAGLNTLRPENHGHIIVSNGATSFYLDRFVKGDNGTALQNEFKDVKRELKESHARSKVQSKETVRITALQNELKDVKRELEEYRELSEARSKELVRVQPFLPRDLLSPSELSQMVSNLNDENFQAAACFSASLTRRQRQWKSERDTQTAYRTACMMIGEQAARVLVSNASEPHSQPDQILGHSIMQIYLAKFCTTKIERWYEGGEEINDFLSTIYREIRCEEGQALSGLWRKMTNARTRFSSDNWLYDFTSGLQSIMELAAWQFSSVEKGRAFKQQLKPIFEAILNLRIALGEHFTSADIEVFSPPPGAPFDPQRMDGMLDDGRGIQENGGGGGGGGGDGSEGIIIGTSGIGLREVQASHGTDNIILLPKVILQSTLG